MSELLVKHFGWRALLVQGDPLVLERWKWLRARFPHAGRSATGRTLDAGCGNGCFALWAAAQGDDVVGLSDAVEDVGKAQDRARLIGLDNVVFEARDLRTLSADAGDPLGSFDSILCLEVVEHVLDDSGLLRALGARLRPGGRLLLTSPTNDHRPLFGEEQHQTRVEDGRHVRWGYSEAQLATVLGDAGFEAIEFSRFGGYLTQRLCEALWRLSAVSFPLAWIVTFPLRAVTVIDQWLTASLGIPFMSLGVVARKSSCRALGAP